LGIEDYEQMGMHGGGGDVSEPDRAGKNPPATSSRRQSVEELVRAKGVSPVESIDDLKAYSVDLFESDEEVEEFLAFVRQLRNADRVQRFNSARRL
jgi:hypothetical protein